MRMSNWRCHLGPLVALALAAIALPLAAASQPSPQTESLPPEANPGYFLATASATAPWHGCSDTAYASLPEADLVPEEVNVAHSPANAQRAVAFKVNPTVAPYFSWKARAGWTICGAQATVVLDNNTLRTSLLSEVAYPSGASEGSTSKSGQETITTFIPKNALDESAYRQFEGKHFMLTQFQDVTVFVRKG